jgi:hypothetical protein
MKRMVLAASLLVLVTLLVPPLRERADPHMATAGSWTAEQLAGPLSPVTNWYKGIRAEAELEKAARLMVGQRNQGMRLPEPARVGEFLNRHEIATDGLDPWGTPYLMVQEADSVALVSAGPDGRYDTDDDLAARFPHRSPRGARR